MVTIDASVWVAADRDDEEAHDVCAELLARSLDGVDAITPRTWLDRRPRSPTPEVSEGGADAPTVLHAAGADEAGSGDDHHA